MQLIPKSVEVYLEEGDPLSMDKVRNFLMSNLNIDDSIEKILLHFNYQEIADAIALHINIDLQNLDARLRENHISHFAVIVRLVFREFIEQIFIESGNSAVLKFIADFEDNLQLANWTHNDCLTDFISVLDINKIREKYLKPTNLLENNTSKSKITLIWNTDANILAKLANIIADDYNIIKAPVRFQNFFLKPESDNLLTVNKNKIGYFVCLIDRLVTEKYLIIKGGKGFWILLAEKTFDYDTKLLDEKKSKFKSLNSKIKKEIQYNSQIINEIDAIMKQMLK